MSSHARVDELLAHHDHRLELCMASVVGGAVTGFEVAADLPWTRRRRALRDLDNFNQGLAVLETLHHLSLLHARGTLTQEIHEGTAYFGAPVVT